MSKVVLIRCESYDEQAVKAAVQKGIGLLGGAAQFARPNEKILLKPNWIVAAPPEKCATTHPAVFRAVCEVFQQTGARLSYGDSPGHTTPENAAHKTGFEKVASGLGIPLADFQGGRQIVFEQAVQNRIFTFANGVLESDGLISLPKLKTQQFLKLTGAVKNQFGCIPGMLKGEYHVKLPRPADFAQMLVDINSYLKPRLFIMDGIVAMDGNGPMSGDPIKMNVLLFSADPIALDATVCRIIDVNPEYSFTVTRGAASGLGTYAESEIELLGDPIDSFKNPRFNVNREPLSNVRIGGGFVKAVNNIIIPRPYITESLCRKCGVCVKMCPVEPKALDFHDGDKSRAPTYKYDRCIHCFCCQEVCPEGAIKIKNPIIRRLFGRKKKQP
jgi:uncharacterized protein (DUF362 family)/ferredoxin